MGQFVAEIFFDIGERGAGHPRDHSSPSASIASLRAPKCRSFPRSAP